VEEVGVEAFEAGEIGVEPAAEQAYEQGQGRAQGGQAGGELGEGGGRVVHGVFCIADQKPLQEVFGLFKRKNALMRLWIGFVGSLHRNWRGFGFC